MTVALAAACVAVIGLLVVLIFRRDKRPIPAAHDEADRITEPGSSGPKAVDDKPVPPRPAVAVARPAVQAPAPDASRPRDEASLLAQLHELAASDPNLSLRIGREAVHRYPDSPDAPEFEWNVVKALFNMGRLEDAEAEARIMLARYPNSSFTGDVVHHLLNHPPNPSDLPPPPP